MSYTQQKITEATHAGDAAAVAYWQHVKEQLDEAPPLTEQQLRELLHVLTPMRRAIEARNTDHGELPGQHPRPAGALPRRTARRPA